MVRTVFWGTMIIAIGAWMWLANLGVVASGIIFDRDWPLIIVALGLMHVDEGISKYSKRRPAMRTIGWGIAVAAVGLWLWLSKLGVPYVDFGTNWPLILVVWGLYIIARRTRKNRRVYFSSCGTIDAEATVVQNEKEELMNEERRKILKMLEENKITADEAERLLDALSGTQPESRSNRFLKIRVWEHGSEKPTVNVTLPISLVKWGLHLVPASAKAKIADKNVDWNAISDALEKDTTGKIVDIDEGEGGDKVEIWVE